MIYVLDGSNIMALDADYNGKFALENLRMVKNELISKGIREESIIVICDAQIRYKVDNPKEYEDLLRQKVILESPAAIRADEVIINYCLKHNNALLVSNDLMRDYYSFLPYDEWILDKRIAIMKIRDDIFLIPMKNDNYKSKLVKKSNDNGAKNSCKKKKAESEQNLNDGEDLLLNRKA